MIYIRSTRKSDNSTFFTYKYVEHFYHLLHTSNRVDYQSIYENCIVTYKCDSDIRLHVHNGFIPLSFLVRDFSFAESDFEDDTEDVSSYDEEEDNDDDDDDSYDGEDSDFDDCKKKTKSKAKKPVKSTTATKSKAATEKATKPATKLASSKPASKSSGTCL